VSGREVTVLTHRRTEEVRDALATLRAAAAEAGVALRFDPDETAKHGIEPGDGILADAPISAEADLCLVLGGDGTILRALQHYLGTEVPVFAINYGQVGFLATVDPDGLEDGVRRALAGDFEAMRLPAISAEGEGRSWHAINDVSFHRKQGLRVADLSYSVGAEEVGRVRCDGLVVATPAGSTGYNLANGGPVMAWGVEGYVVSFVAPHSLTARTLVVAPDDTLTVHNRSSQDPVDVTLDGLVICEVPAGDSLSVSFARQTALLAQVPGASFYHRLRERFGRLAS
jgi:NAD+ kinase